MSSLVANKIASLGQLLNYYNFLYLNINYKILKLKILSKNSAQKMQKAILKKIAGTR